ncbi:MAG: amidohydrolase [Deltaproteobacteria bacterium]|nr:amidohydrolase [Deltaproteobacteria bacterium]
MKNGKEKEFVLDVVNRNSQAISLLGDNIFYFAELGMQEFETSGLMIRILEEAGFRVERNISGMPTAFMATYGSGKPVIALHTEFDATPASSQVTGVAEPRSITEGAPGHTEGHNVNAAVLIGAAFAVKKAMDEFKLPGTLKVFGAPAEEQLVSRPFFVRDGYFKDVDVAIHDHIGGEFGTLYGLRQYALISAEFTFKGVSAHAATAPWKARDALDAVVLMDIGFDKLREHLEPTQRSHRVITDGGDQPNVIPNRATIWWFFRESTAEKAQAIFEKAKRVAEGAAIMTGTTFSVNVLSAVWPTRANKTMAEVIHQNVELVGMPKWTETEQKLARELQSKEQLKPIGLRPEISPLREETNQSTSANDSGEVTWVVPSGRLTFPANIPGITFHHWAAGVALATSIAHKGAVAGAKTMAASTIDLLLDTTLVAKAKETFKEEIADVEYKPLLPPDQKPPLELNKAIMERYRSLMQKHYSKEKPEFR